MKNSYSNIINTQENKTVDDLWTIFTNNINEGMQKYIPTKNTKVTDGYPWITPDLKKLMCKRDKLFKTNRNCRHYKNLKSLVQKKLRNAYWNYIEKIVTPDPENPSNNHSK